MPRHPLESYAGERAKISDDDPMIRVRAGEHFYLTHLLRREVSIGERKTLDANAERN